MAQPHSSSLTVAKTEMSSQQVSINKVMYFCHPSAGEESALRPGGLSLCRTLCLLTCPHAVTTLLPVSPHGGGTHPEVTNDFPFEVTLTNLNYFVLI